MANPGKGKIERLLVVYKAEKSEASLRELASAVSGKVKADLYRFRLTREQAEEAYSDCMERFFVRGALEVFNPEKAIAETYIGAIVRNAVFSMFHTARRERERTASLSAPITETEELLPEERLSSREVQPDSALLADELLKHIRAAVLSIRNGRHREMYLLYLMSGAALKYEDLGAVFGEKQNSARTVINRCKKHVAAVLEKELGDVFGVLSPGDLDAVKEKAARVETWAGTSAREGLEELEALGSAGCLSGASAICGKTETQIAAAVGMFAAKASDNLKITVNEETGSFYTVKEDEPEAYGLEASRMKSLKNRIVGFVDCLGKSFPDSGAFQCKRVKEEPENSAGKGESAIISGAFENKVISGILKTVKR